MPRNPLALRVYETLFPDDSPILDDDPRRGDIMWEVRHVAKAKNLDDAVPYIAWWFYEGAEVNMGRPAPRAREACKRIRTVWRKLSEKDRNDRTMAVARKGGPYVR